LDRRVASEFYVQLLGKSEYFGMELTQLTFGWKLGEAAVGSPAFALVQFRATGL
jgi:hypothetical protein